MLMYHIGIRELGECQQPAFYRARTSRRLLLLTLLKSVYYLHERLSDRTQPTPYHPWSVNMLC